MSAASDRVDVDCFYGSPAKVAKLAGAVPIHSGTFTVTTPQQSNGSTTFQLIAGHACRLRALPALVVVDDHRRSLGGERARARGADAA